MLLNAVRLCGPDCADAAVAGILGVLIFLINIRVKEFGVCEWQLARRHLAFESLFLRKVFVFILQAVYQGS